MAVVLSALAGGLPAIAQNARFCYQFNSGGGTFNVSITNLPGPAATTSLNGITTNSYALSSVSGNSATLSGGGTATAPPLALWLITSAGGGFFNSLTIYIANASNQSLGGVSLTGSTQQIPASGLPQTLPPLSQLFLANVFVSGNPSDVTSITTMPCAGGANGDKSLGNALDKHGSVCCGDPIDLGSGNMYDMVTDYTTTGANRLAFIRYYNSQSAAATVARRLGLRWRSNFDRYLIVNSTTSITAERHNGQQVRFTLTAGRWTPDTDVDLQLSVANGVWSLTNADDSVETYSTFFSGVAPLNSIRARNGYTQTLEYSAAGDLTTVRDSVNRVLRFEFANSLLQRFTTPDGLVISYSYTAGTANGSRLTRVAYSTNPATSRTYSYTNASLPFALTRVTDENGNTEAAWTYDSQARALSSEGAEGANKMTIVYNDSDGSRTVTNALGQRTLYLFTVLQGTPKVTQIDRQATSTTSAATRRFTYDSNGFLASETDWNGNLTTIVSNNRGQPTTIVQASGTPLARTTTITYHATLHVPLTVATQGLTTAFTYDPAGNLLTRTETDTTTGSVPYSTRGMARTWTYTWVNGLITSIKGPRTDGADLTRFTYDSTGRLTSVNGPLGHTIRVDRHKPSGLPETIVDANKVTATLDYDPRMRLLSRTLSTTNGDLATRFAYDAAGSLLSAETPDGLSLRYSYDPARRLIGIADSSNQTIGLTLDAIGNPTQTDLVDDGGSSALTRSGSFDALGRRIASTGAFGQTTEYAYDSNGNTISSTDPMGRKTLQTFDALNRRIRVEDPAGGITAVTYDTRNRPLTVVAPNGATTTYIYNGFGEVIQQTSPDSGTTVYRYDAAGNLAQVTDGRGIVANYAYDAMRRRTAVEFPGSPAENVKFTYDETGHGFGIGQLTTVQDAAGTLTRSYDEQGNILTESRTAAGSPHTSTTGYTYDRGGRVASITYGSGWKVQYSRDPMGRISGIAAQPPGDGEAVTVVSDVTYRPFGPVSGLQFGNHVRETRQFDADYRTTRVENTASERAVLGLTYEYDAADNVVSLSNDAAPAHNQQFAYDLLDRLTEAAGAYGRLQYSYDAVGNRLSQAAGAGTTSYGYAARSNQLTSLVTPNESKLSVSYTGSGNIASISQDGNATTLGYEYNHANRLASVTEGGRELMRYTYDAFGRRVAKVSPSGGLQEFRYDSRGHLLEEINPQGAAVVDYIYLDDRPMATIEVATGRIFYLHTDRLDTPQVATSSSQEVAWLGHYLPFGELMAESSQTAAMVQNLRFPGQEAEPETGLYYNGARDYLPGLGRYLQTDPIGLAGGLNTYGYAAQNPTRFTDPTGEFLPAITAVIGGVFTTVQYVSLTDDVTPLGLLKAFGSGAFIGGLGGGFALGLGRTSLIGIEYFAVNSAGTVFTAAASTTAATAIADKPQNAPKAWRDGIVAIFGSAIGSLYQKAGDAAVELAGALASNSLGGLIEALTKNSPKPSSPTDCPNASPVLRLTITPQP